MKKIIYSPGEPSGIGPDLIIQLCTSKFWVDIKLPIVCLADPKLLIDRASKLGKKIKLLQINDLDKIQKNKKNHIQVLCVTKCNNLKPGKLYKSNASYVLKNLDFAIENALNDKNTALVTGPISKENIISINKKFQGHTEYIQKKTTSDDVLMLLGSNKLKVALATTHLPLKNVAKAITKKLITSKAKILNDELKDKFKIKNPKITLLGLNPHAGEGGKIGSEEKDILIPAVKELRRKKIDISHPKSADTAFTKKILNDTDAYLGMYHDQVLTPIKTLFEYDAINITMGLPFLRVTPDHGPNEKMYKKNKSNPQSLIKALEFLDKN